MNFDKKISYLLSPFSFESQNSRVGIMSTSRAYIIYAELSQNFPISDRYQYIYQKSTCSYAVSPLQHKHQFTNDHNNNTNLENCIMPFYHFAAKF